MSTGVTELDRPIPLYMQIVRQIRAQIASGNSATETGCHPSGR
jgi:DNA-binding transcriptional regulator YhcF (GntR family)